MATVDDLQNRGGMTDDDIRNLCRSLGYPLNGTISDQINIIRNRVGFRGVVSRNYFDNVELRAILRIYGLSGNTGTGNSEPAGTAGTLGTAGTAGTAGTVGSAGTAGTAGSSDISPNIGLSETPGSPSFNKFLADEDWLNQLRKKISQGSSSPSYVSTNLIGLPSLNSQSSSFILSPMISLQTPKPDLVLSELTLEELRKICLILQIPIAPSLTSVDSRLTYLSKIREYLSYINTG